MVIHFPGDHFSLVALFRTEGPTVHLNQADDVWVYRFYEIHYLVKIAIGVLYVPAVRHREVETPSNASPIAYVVQ